MKTKDQFIAFLGSLLQDYRQNGDTWGNNTLEDFLEAMRAWTIDSDGYYKSIGAEPPSEPDWQRFADILRGATVYE